MDKFGTHSVRYLRDKRGVTSGFVLLNDKRIDDVIACEKQRLWMSAETFVIHFSYTLYPPALGLGFWRGITHTLWSESCGVLLQQTLRSWAAAE